VTALDRDGVGDLELARPVRAADQSTHDAFEQVSTGYYLSPDPQRACLALVHMLSLLATSETRDLPVRFDSLFYLFARIAQVSSQAFTQFTSVAESFDGPHAPIVRSMLRAPIDPTFPNALKMPLEGPESLDLLWAEFFVTGSSEPILRIISALDRPDCVRRHLDLWVSERSLFGNAKRRTTVATLASVGLLVDLDQRAIVTTGDLDCLCFSIAERKFPIFKHLPFTLSPEDVLALLAKGSALWSLRLNSRKHPIVAKLCAEEAQRAGGPGRRRLTESVDHAGAYRL
jgi:hypothetical protein